MALGKFALLAMASAAMARQAVYGNAPQYEDIYFEQALRQRQAPSPSPSPSPQPLPPGDIRTTITTTNAQGEETTIVRTLVPITTTNNLGSTTVLTDTLIPFTTTDSDGSKTVITKTVGPKSPPYVAPPSSSTSTTTPNPGPGQPHSPSPNPGPEKSSSSSSSPPAPPQHTPTPNPGPSPSPGQPGKSSSSSSSAAPGGTPTPKTPGHPGKSSSSSSSKTPNGPGGSPTPGHPGKSSSSSSSKTPNGPGGSPTPGQPGKSSSSSSTKTPNGPGGSPTPGQPGKSSSSSSKKPNGPGGTPTPGTPLPPGESITRITTTNANGQTTVLTETLEPFTTTNSLGQTVVGTHTLGGGAPGGTPTPGTPLPPGEIVTRITTTNSNGQQTVITETLKPVTTTNSLGQTVVGTETLGGQTTTNIAGLTTYTTFPSDISTSTTDVSHNTHDSHGHPVLAPWPGCWFCPPGGHGIVLFGIGPGIYPGGGPPPGFPTPFPPLTIEPDGTPEYETDPNNDPTSRPSSQSTCSSTETVTRITYYVSYATDSDGSTTATSTTSTYESVVTGCDVTGTTATTTAKGGCKTCGSCVSYLYDGSGGAGGSAPSPSPAVAARAWMMLPSGPMGKRTTPVNPPQAYHGIAGRIMLEDSTVTDNEASPYHMFEKRARRKQKNFGSCALTNQLTENLFPKVKDYGAYPAASSYFIITQSAAPAGQACPPAPTLLSTNNLAGKSLRGMQYQTTSGAAPWVNSDHVYEISNLANFFTSRINAGVLCADINSKFFAPILKNIWKLLPGEKYPDMAALDDVINNVKGNIFNANFKISPVGGTGTAGEKLLSGLQNAGMAVAAINTPEFVTLFLRTHQRLYNGFLGLDAKINCPPKGAVVPAGLQATWAESYSAWAVGFLQQQGNAASQAAVNAYAALNGYVVTVTGTDGSTTVDALGSAVQQASATFPPNSFLFNSAGMGALVLNQATLPVKRDGGACVRQTQPTTLSTPGVTPGGPGGPGTTGGTTGGITGKTTGQTTITTPAGPGGTPAAPACSPFQDPDQGVSGYCQCTNGATTKFATGANPCPYKTAPPLPSSTPPSVTPVPPMTVTETNGAVISCTSFNYMNNPAGSGTITECVAGSTITVIPEPTATCHVHIEQGDTYYGDYFWKGELWDGNGNVADDITQDDYSGYQFSLGDSTFGGTVTIEPATSKGESIEDSVLGFDFSSTGTNGQTFEQQWNTTATNSAVLPWCTVGGWSNGFLAPETNRNMDCYFGCYA